MTLKKRLIPVLLAALIAQSTTAHAASILRDAETEETLRTFSTHVFEEAGLSPSSVRFVIVNDNELNAFVAGGQNIFVNSGLILETDNPDELIGVIAHETGHIAGGHLFRSQEVMDNLTMEAMLASLIGMAAAVGGQSGEAGMAVGSAGSSMAQRLMLRHSRVQESAADQAGVRFLQAAGLPLDGFLTFMKKLSSQELLPENQQSAYVRTHPLSRDRVDFLENVLSQKKDNGRIPSDWTEKHARIKAKLMGYLFPDRALRDDGDSIASRYGRATALYRRGKMTDALAGMDALVKAEPNNPYFREFKGQILFESGRIDDAIPVYAEAVRLDPDSALIRGAYARALIDAKENSDKNLAKGIEQLNLAVQKEPRQPDLHHSLGVAYGRQGNEGMSRLHLAEEALLMQKFTFAHTQASIAQQKLSKNSAGWLRADDILQEANRRKNKKKD